MSRQCRYISNVLIPAGWLFVGFALLIFPHGVSAAAVSLDGSFGKGRGWVSTHFKNPSAAVHSKSFSRDAIVQTDGKIVLAGTADGPECGDFFQCFVLVRYDSTGALDTGFGNKGKAITVTGKAFSAITSVIQQIDKKLVVTGYAYGQSSEGFIVARYNENGTLDAGFDGDGMLTTVVDGGGSSCSVIQQADGKLVVAGLSGNSNENITLVRYELNGSLDTAFGSGGIVTLVRTDSPQNIGCNVIEQADGKLVVANVDYGGLGQVIVRYNPDGSLDTSFDGDGVVSVSMWITSIIQQTDGKIVAAGNVWTGSSYDFALVRYNSDGTQDVSFGVSGVVSTDLGGYEYSYSLIQQADEKLLLAGASSSDSAGDAVALVRYNLDGSLDESFDEDGIFSWRFTDGKYYASSVVQQKDGKLIVACATDTGAGDFLVARFIDDSTGGFYSDRAGSSVAFAGDVNGDGYGDYVIGIPGYDVPALPPLKAIKNAGRAEVISGKSGAVLMSVNGAAANDAMGFSVAGGADIDGDGYDDVVVGAPKADDVTNGLVDAGSVTVLYGPDGVRRQTFYGDKARALAGTAVALGDVNADGYADIISGAPKDDDATHPFGTIADTGSVTVRSGAPGNAKLITYYGDVAGALAGTAVAAGNVDAVAGADVIIGAPNDEDVINHLKGAGSVTVYNIASPAIPVMKKYGAVSKAYLGKSVAAGNVNGVQGDEVLAGAPGDDNGTSKDTGSVTVFFADSTPSVTKYGAVAKAGLGNSVAVGDVDGDGKADIIAGASKDDVPATVTAKRMVDAGSVTIWSGNGFVPIGSPLYGSKAKDYFGFAVSAGDINRDGKADLIIGIPGFDAAPVPPARKLVMDAGAVRVLSGATF